MTDRVLSWKLPPVGPRQLPLSHTVIDFRADPSFPWTALPAVPASAPQQAEFMDVNPGTMYYRGTVYDAAGTACITPAETSITVAYDPPGAPLNMTVTDT